MAIVGLFGMNHRDVVSFISEYRYMDGTEVLELHVRYSVPWLACVAKVLRVAS